MGKRICIVMGGHFSATIGGAQFQAQCLVERLKSRGDFEIHYLARVINPEYVPHGYHVVQIARPTQLRQYAFAFDTLPLLRLLKRIGPDVIYQRGLKAYTGVAAYYGKRTGCRTVFHVSSDLNVRPDPIVGVRASRWLERLDRKFEEYGLANVDHIVAQTNLQASLLRQTYGLEATAVIPNFHPLPLEPLDKPSTPVRIVWVANFKEVKQPELFVDLANSLRSEAGLRFVMIGRPGPAAKYSGLHKAIEIAENIEYLGELPIEEVNHHLAAAHLFVNTSRAEGFPNTFIQAWMRRVPTITLNVNPDEVFDSRRIGVCTNNDFDALRATVLTLARDHERRRAMGSAAEKHALENHSPQVVERLIGLLETGHAGPPAD